MIFNSMTFAVFFAVFFLLYWLACARSQRAQNLLVLAGSYVFYAWGDWRLLPLLIGNSVVFYLLGVALDTPKDERRRAWLMALGLTVGLGGLIFFKYAAFLEEVIVHALAVYGVTLHSSSMRFVLPLGISFYTFRNLSYLFDVHNGKQEATRDWLTYFSYVAFFPCVISGPIDRPKKLIPQLERTRVFDYEQACDGMRRMVWGLFKKVVIADNCAAVTDVIFSDYRNLPPSSLLLGAFLYTIQLYTDFSGYSDIAIGAAQLLGFKVTNNFNYPFFSQNIAEFWRRWHISLTSWLTDYVFTPLSIAMRDLGKLGVILAVLVNFTLIGIWHGANWTFILFGFLHGCFFIPLILRGTLNRRIEIPTGRRIPSAAEARNMFLTFLLVMFTFILIRTASVEEAALFMQRLASPGLLSWPVVQGYAATAACVFVLAQILILVEWLNRDKPYAVSTVALNWPRPLRWSFYYTIFLTVFLAAEKGQNFIYFQF